MKLPIKASIRLGVIAGLLFVSLLVLSGCTLTTEQKAQAQTQIDRAVDVRNATTQSAADAHEAAAKIRASATTLPADDPVRPMALRTADSMEHVAKEYEKRIPAIDASIATLQAAVDGDPIAFGKALEGVPVVGKYATLLILLGGLGYQGWQNLKKSGVIKDQEHEIDAHAAVNAELNGIATQLVKSVEVAMPTKSDDTKLKLAAVQDEVTKEFVDKVKLEEKL